jgi:hypothetical protein
MIEIEISEEEMISTMISSLVSLIHKGFPIRITHTSKQPLSRSQSMSSRILKNIPELKDWADDVRKLLRARGAAISAWLATHPFGNSFLNQRQRIERSVSSGTCIGPPLEQILTE